MGDQSYGSSSSFSTSSYKNVLCKCGEHPKIWTSTTKKNPGRHFIRCPNSLDSSKDCKFFVWVDEDLGLHRYKSKVNELNRENMDLFKDNMIISKKNMELEKENICLQKKLMKLEVIEKKEIDMFMVKVLFGIVLVSIFICFIIT
ncbi:uncharacterized protein At4g04775 [Lactuca sativa]|uniref:GRF-type domain-containing protein n=1 Tax=Lactuca sativa TaxID=4236 RepID=A0A9R1VQN5_LACSA|nr:uncharacterized protein At4g04775 [Lactuca sativa]KAJ0210751.1 hypothetical protein LSAT_V11C400194000 [Lactuca sativa]